MDAITAGLIGTVIGGVLTATPAVITFWIGKRSEEKRQIQQLATQAALEQWKFHCEIAQKTGASIMPLEIYLIAAFKLADMANSDSLNTVSARERIRELLAVLEIVEVEIKDYNKKKQQKNE